MSVKGFGRERRDLDYIVTGERKREPGRKVTKAAERMSDKGLVAENFLASRKATEPRPAQTRVGRRGKRTMKYVREARWWRGRRRRWWEKVGRSRQGTCLPGGDGRSRLGGLAGGRVLRREAKRKSEGLAQRREWTAAVAQQQQTQHSHVPIFVPADQCEAVGGN
jgi:hypothetical protein